MEEEHANFLYDQYEPCISISDEDLEKQCIEESDRMQSIED